MASPKLIPVAQEDYLEQDPSIRGQKYVCLSFVSPEDAIKNKEAYFLQQYLTSFSSDLKRLFESTKQAFKENVAFVDALHGIQERHSHLFDGEKLNEEFEFYKASNSERLEGDYLEKNNFQTTIRGIKVRGSYETLKEAQIRAEVLKRKDGRFNVFIAEVGCWCPWSPNPEELQNQEYAETQLNTLVKNYNDNQHEKDEFFEQRKEDLKKKAIEENDLKNAANKKAAAIEDDGVRVLEDAIGGDDPWMRRKVEQVEDANATAKDDAKVVSDVVADIVSNVVAKDAEDAEDAEETTVFTAVLVDAVPSTEAPTNVSPEEKETANDVDAADAAT